MRTPIARELTNTATVALQDKCSWLMDLRLEELLRYADLRGHRYRVEDYARWERIPDVYAERIAVTWLRKGRSLSRMLRAWLHVAFPGKNPTLAEMVEFALHRREPARSQILTDLRAFLGFVADAYPLGGAADGARPQGP